MTTEEKNALAKEYAIKKYPYDPHAGPISHQEILQYQRDAEREFISIYELGQVSRDKEVSDLVEALRKVRRGHVHHRALCEGFAFDSSHAHDVIAHNEFVNEIDSLLSKYPVNTLPNG